MTVKEYVKRFTTVPEAFVDEWGAVTMNTGIPKASAVDSTY